MDKNRQSQPRVYSFGLFVEDKIYRHLLSQPLPNAYAGVERFKGDSAMRFVTAEWLEGFLRLLQGLGVAIDTNHGGLSAAAVSILGALGDSAVLIAPYGNDAFGRACREYLKKLGVNISQMPRVRGASSVNVIRNLETEKRDEQGNPIFWKDYAIDTTAFSGFPYSDAPALQAVKEKDIVHLGGMDLVLSPKDEEKAVTAAKYRKAITEMEKVAGEAKSKGAVVVGDFCMGDSLFWSMVKDDFFKDVAAAKPSLPQAIAIYNSRHAEEVKLDTEGPQRLLSQSHPELVKIINFLLELGFGAVFMTLDVGGTIIAAKEGSVFGKVEPRHIPIIPARKFTDGTGCGDAFTSGIIHGILKKWSMFDSACFATAIGSLIAERVGVCLEPQYTGKGKWLAAVEARLTEARKAFANCECPFCEKKE